MHPILFHLPLPYFGNVPIYSYGVMLGLSLVIGWYLTLGLADRDGLPKDTMANCYVVTAFSAIVGSRLLYVATNPAEFDSITQWFQFSRGGLVAYGGFLGGLVGSFLYLRRHGISLLPWADVAVPSLASGLLITRIGCYLAGCDFGKPLEATAPAFLTKAGTFPRWAEVAGSPPGSPALLDHIERKGLSPDAVTSLPVHPTQLYESLLGLALLILLLTMRRHQKFRGEIFLYFAFFYGVGRFALEILRDDFERGSMPPALAPHVLLPACYFVFAVAFALGLAPRIGSTTVRNIARAVAFVPMVALYVALKPETFSTVLPIQMSTSQLVGLLTAVLGAMGFAVLLKNAELHPREAMAMPHFPDADADDDAAPRKASASPVKKRAADGDDDDDDDDSSKGAGDAKPVPEELPDPYASGEAADEAKVDDAKVDDAKVDDAKPDEPSAKRDEPTAKRDATWPRKKTKK